MVLQLKSAENKLHEAQLIHQAARSAFLLGVQGEESRQALTSLCMNNLLSCGFLKLEIRIQPSINNSFQFCSKCFNKCFTWIKMGLDDLYDHDLYYDLYGAHDMCSFKILGFFFNLLLM